MSELKIADEAPNFTMPTDGAGSVTLSDFAGKSVLVYFYPKDDTSGCTSEAQAFTEAADAFRAASVVVIGVSKDSVAAHDKFKKKYGLDLILASDEAGDVVERYGAWVEKSMYGRKYMGIDRSTFLIGPDGRIRHIWRKVKVPGHVAAILKAAQA